jgi:N-acetylglucosaminyldiphosphoundecaprenol N-acetyl-beta-D-mannosaminyltransferase
MESVRILGLKVDCVSMESAVNRIEEFIAAKTPRHLVTADASMVVIARSDPELGQIVEQADLVTPDGAGILWASRRLRMPIKHKVSGVDLVAELSRLSAGKGYRLYFLGAAPGVAEAAARNLADRFPGAAIVGTRDGYFNGDQEAAIIDDIRQAKPDVLFVAMGIPKQEKWINRYKDELGVPVSVGIGGSFDVYSGRVKRAPLWMQRNGLEWLYRLWSNPKKIGKVMTLPRFAVMTLRQQYLRAQ